MKFLFFLSIWCLNINAQTNLLNQSQIKEDTDILIATLNQAHPGLDIYLNRSEIDSAFNKISSLHKEITFMEYYILLLELITTFGDGHTDLYEGKKFRILYPYLNHTLPFEVTIINDKVYITKDYSEKKSLPLFSEILFINDISIDQILQTLYRLTPSDGNRLGFKKEYIEKIFGRLFSKLFEISEEYNIKLKQSDNSILTYTVKGIKDKIMHPNQYDKIPLDFKLNKSENFAILTVNTFQYRLMRKNGIDFHKLLKKSFKSIRKNKIDHLIIDLRENYGGDNILGITLYSYLTQGKFKAMSPSITKLRDTISVSKYSNFPNGNYPFLKTHKIKRLENNLFEIKDGIDSKETNDSDYIYKGPKSKPENISKNKFKGHVYCITSGLTFSAAANFATLLSRNDNVTFIGQETGGANGYYCGGGFYSITLPNSKFVLQVPFMKRCVSAAKNHKHGVIPDFMVDRNLNQLQNKEDLEMQKIKELIKIKD
ncbi:MAG: S41 family peptidase [Saprospiraceae bacterium]